MRRIGLLDISELVCQSIEAAEGLQTCREVLVLSLVEVQDGKHSFLLQAIKTVSVVQSVCHPEISDERSRADRMDFEADYYQEW